MNENEISDKRSIKDFKGITFSKYKKADAKKELLNNMSNGKIEPACYWAAEFICAGHYADIWEIIILFCSKHIHLGNPKLPIYLDLRLDHFKQIMNGGYQDNIIKMRNNNKVRKLFGEIISVLCLSKKKNTFDNIKINKDDFNITKITYNLKADSTEYATRIFKKDDPSELFIGINEFFWNLLKGQKNSALACWWLEWILGFEDICKKENKKYSAARRSNIPVDTNFQKDVIWILWECLLFEANNRSKGLHKIITSMLNIFCLRYKPGVRKRRKYLIYFAINLLTEPLDNTIPIIKNEKIVENITSKINIIYKQIKKNEIRPDTDYLFNNSITNNNLEKTINKLEKMNALVGMVPRK
tara:strand:- start:707 stop:1777 length:1071 start_codon:yes stop_codon:yes gene_type:complete